MITPAEYVRDCLAPCEAVGAQICTMRQDAPGLGWSAVEIRESEDLIRIRYENNPRFVFPTTPTRGIPAVWARQ
jgi:hypothetical protein